MSFSRQKLQEWTNLSQQALNTVQSLNWDSNISILPNDAGCQFQLHTGSFSHRRIQCQLCSDLERVTPLYGKLGQPLNVGSEWLQVTRTPGQPYPLEIVNTPPLFQISPLGSEDTTSSVRTIFVASDPITVSTINQEFLSNIWPDNVQKHFLTGFCGEDAIQIQEVVTPLSKLDWRDFRSALKQIAEILKKGQKFGLKLGSNSSWGLRDGRVVLIPGSDLRVSLPRIDGPDGPGGTDNNDEQKDRRKEYVRMVSEDFQLEIPQIQVFNLFESNATENEWFLIPNQLPSEGIPGLQASLNWYQTLMQLQNLPNFQKALQQDKQLREMWRKWFRGDKTVESLLQRPLRQNPFAIL